MSFHFPACSSEASLCYLQSDSGLTFWWTYIYIYIYISIVYYFHLKYRCVPKIGFSTDISIDIVIGMLTDIFIDISIDMFIGSSIGIDILRRRREEEGVDFFLKSSNSNLKGGEQMKKQASRGPSFQPFQPDRCLLLSIDSNKLFHKLLLE